MREPSPPLCKAWMHYSHAVRLQGRLAVISVYHPLVLRAVRELGLNAKHNKHTVFHAYFHGVKKLL